MKHIGIVDVTSVGAFICANEIVTQASKLGSSGSHPELTIHAFSFSLYKKYVLKKDWIGMAHIILNSIEKLLKTGAEFIIIPSNTPHYAIEEIRKKSLAPVLNLIDLVSEECFKKKYKKVLVLGTKATMMDGLYDNYLKKRKITLLIPNESGCNLIQKLIIDHIIPLKNDRQTVSKKIANGVIKKINCDAIILGCTELSDVYNENNLGKPVIDSTRLLAHKALEFAIQKNWVIKQKRQILLV